MSYPSPRSLHTSSLLVSTALLFGSTATRAAEWKGSTETVDGIEYAHNPAEPMDGATSAELTELWRIGGDSDGEGELFGVINRVKTDESGNVYLLDQQLNEVKVFSPDGEYLRTIGREGEGPGEFRNPLDMCFLADGNLAVMQMAPGRLVMFTPAGDPAGDHALPRLEGGGTPGLVRGDALGDRLLLLISTNTPGQNKVDIHRSLVLVDSDGVQQKQLLTSTRELEFIKFTFDETVWVTFDNRWSVLPGGDLYAVENYLPYEISVWNREGNKKRVIQREYTHYERSQEQRQEQHDIFDGFLQNQLPQYDIKVSPYDSDVTQIYPREDGSLWVLSSRGARDQPDGALGVFDVFDDEGHFVRQVTLLGQGDPLNDGYYFMGDRIYVVTGQLDANIASRGGRRGESEEETEEAEPISVICYQLPQGA
jgi:hypothetical protein